MPVPSDDPVATQISEDEEWQVLPTFRPRWPRSCSNGWHNTVSRGERELRGERRGKGGRSQQFATVPSFFVLSICLLHGPVAAQPIGLELRAGAAGSTALAEDAIAGPGLRQRFGAALRGPVRMEPTLGAWAGLAARAPLRRNTYVEVSTAATFTRLDAADDAGTRDLQSLAVLHGVVAVRYPLAPSLSLAGGFGGVKYFTEERAVFAEGSAISPLVEADLAWHRDVGGRVLSLRAFAQAHRFGTAAIRRAAGADGTVFRYGLGAGWLIGGAR